MEYIAFLEKELMLPPAYYWENIEKYVEDSASVAYVSNNVLWAAAWRQNRFDAPRSRLTISSVYRLVPG